MSRGVVLEQNSSRRDGREFGQTINKNYRHKRCARSCAARASKKKIIKKAKSNIISLTVPPKKKPNASDVPALPPAALRKELSKKQEAAAPHFFFQGVVVACLNMLSDEMPLISSHIVGKDQRNFGTTTKNK